MPKKNEYEEQQWSPPPYFYLFVFFLFICGSMVFFCEFGEQWMRGSGNNAEAPKPLPPKKR